MYRLASFRVNKERPCGAVRLPSAFDCSVFRTDSVPLRPRFARPRVSLALADLSERVNSDGALIKLVKCGSRFSCLAYRLGVLRSLQGAFNRSPVVRGEIGVDGVQDLSLRILVYMILCLRMFEYQGIDCVLLWF